MSKSMGDSGTGEVGAGLGSWGRLVFHALRWKTLRGGWFLPHLRDHEAFDARSIEPGKPIHVIVAIVDHFEPTSKQGPDAAAASVRAWCESYRTIAERHRDAAGRPPQHTWFYRFEYLNPGCVRALADAAYEGLGEVEFHLHHGQDTHASFAARLKAGLDLGNQFGAMLTAEAEPRRRFGYIAGNWSLDNGSRDPAKSGCNTELIALREDGCFADFTFPAVGSHAQPRKTNAIYYATDDPRPKSYDTGVDVEAGRPPSGDLMIVQGPSVWDRSTGSIEAADLEDFAPPDPRRIAHWLRANIRVRGRPDWIFVKLHTHGMQSRKTFLGPQLDSLFTEMERRWNAPPFRLHYVTARELYNVVKAAEAGHAGDPGDHLDFEVPQPANRKIRCDRPWQLEWWRPDGLSVRLLDPGPATMEFSRGPLRRVQGTIRRVEAAFRGNTLAQLHIDGEGEFAVQADSPPPPELREQVHPGATRRPH